MGRPKGLLIIGETRTGKTSWARSLGEHIYFNTYWDISKWPTKTTAGYVVIDDIPFTSLGRLWKPVIGCQLEFTATDKYIRKRTIYWGKPFIWLLNSSPFPGMDPDDRDYINSNCVVYHMAISERFY